MEKYIESIKKILSERDKHRTAMCNAETEAKEAYDKQVGALNVQYHHLLGKKVKYGDIVGIFRGFLTWEMLGTKGIYVSYLDKFYPCINKLKKDGTESAVNYRYYSIADITSKKFELTPLE